MGRAIDNPTLGYLLWRLATTLRADVDRDLAPLGLTHAQYTLLASLYGFTRTGARPSQRELAEWTGLESIFVSKLARALEQAGLIEREAHPADTRAVQLRLTDRGAEVAVRAMAIVHAFLEEFTAPLGGTQTPRTRKLARTLQTLLNSNQQRSNADVSRGNPDRPGRWRSRRRADQPARTHSRRLQPGPEPD